MASQRIKKINFDGPDIWITLDHEYDETVILLENLLSCKDLCSQLPSNDLKKLRMLQSETPELC